MGDFVLFKSTFFIFELLLSLDLVYILVAAPILGVCEEVTLNGNLGDEKSSFFVSSGFVVNAKLSLLSDNFLTDFSFIGNEPNFKKWLHFFSTLFLEIDFEVEILLFSILVLFVFLADKLNL